MTKKLKKYLAALMMICFGGTFSPVYGAYCGCGHHQTGLVKYTTEGANCCSDLAAGLAWVDHYTFVDGIWVYDYKEWITPQEAHDICCPNV